MRMVLWPLVFLLVVASLVSGHSYTNGWAAECPGGEEEARGVARDTGCSMDEGEVIPGIGTASHLLWQIETLLEPCVG